jgi:hypothetical protein
MKKYILPIFIFAGLFYSCGYDSQQETQTYLDSLNTAEKKHKWSKFAEKIGFKSDDLSLLSNLKQDLNTPSSLVGELEKNLMVIIGKYWQNGLKPDELIASNFAKFNEPVSYPIGAAEDQQLYTLYIMSYEVKKKTAEGVTEQVTNYAYLSVPKGKIEGNPVVYFHKDDRGLSADLLEEEVGTKVLRERLIIAPAGSGQAISKTYTPRKDPTDIIAKSTHTDALPWSDTVDDAISLLRGLRKEAPKGPDDTKFPFNIDDTKLAQVFGYKFDFLGFSTGGLTAGLVASKVGGYINQEALLEIQKLEDNKKGDALTKHLSNKYSFFIQKLILVAVPGSFVSGPFRMVLKACVTGDIRDQRFSVSKYAEYPGIRHTLQLFDSYRKADMNSDEENTSLDKLYQEVLSRDLAFQIPFALGAAMNGSVVNLSGDNFPQVALLHHKNDKMIPYKSGTLPLFITVGNNDLRKLLAIKYETPFYLYDSKESVFTNNNSEKPSMSFHLGENFWKKETSKNENGESAREMIDHILDHNTKKTKSDYLPN